MPMMDRAVPGKGNLRMAGLVLMAGISRITTLLLIMGDLISVGRNVVMG